jgi:hypothetical protein
MCCMGGAAQPGEDKMKARDAEEGFSKVPGRAGKGGKATGQGVRRLRYVVPRYRTFGNLANGPFDIDH